MVLKPDEKKGKRKEIFVKKLRSYEGVLLLHPDTNLEDQKALFQQNKKIIENHEGHIHHCDTWGKRTIANSIKNIRKALFFHYSFYTNNKAVAELERTLRINSSVLKFLHSNLGQTSLEKHLKNYYLQLETTSLKEKERERKRLERKKERESQQRVAGTNPT